MRGYLALLGALVGSVLLSTTAFAQGGSIAGVVRDTSGAVLPGVTVEAASPALIEKVRSAVTDGSGQYRIVDLRPGTYSVTATLTGFNTFKRDGIEISGAAVVTINADLKVGSIEETVTVSGETPVVDLQSTTKERVMSKEVLDALPTGRTYFTLGVLVPGVTSTSRDVGGVTGGAMDSLTAHGGAVGDQRVLQNCLNVMTLVTAGGNIGGMVPNTSGAQEVAIDTSAASAERQTGGVSINFIPKDGGNTIRGSVFATGASEGQQASNLTQGLQDQGLTSLSKYKSNWDINPGVGGPIMQDKLWYYYTYRTQGARNYAGGLFYNQNEFLPNVYTYVPNPGRPGLSLHGDWQDSQVRLTWQANPKNKLAGTWDTQYLCRCPSLPAGVNPSLVSPEAATETRSANQQLIHAEWWSPLTSKVLVEFVALHRTERWGGNLRPGSEGGSLAVTPAQYALYPQMIGVTQTSGTVGVPNGMAFHGPSAAQSNFWTPNYTYRWAVSYITGAHAFKVGGQDSFGYHTHTNYLTSLDTLNRPVRYRFASQLTPDQVTVFQTPWNYKVDENHDLGLFAQDRWTMNRLTVSGGVRFDYFNSSSPEQTLQASALGRPQTTYAAIDDTVNWKDVTPRFGAAYDLRGDGKTALKISINKYIAGQGLGGLPTNATPASRLTQSNSRTWNDNFFGAGDPRSGNFVVDCDLSNTAINNECRNAGNSDFVTGNLPITNIGPDGNQLAGGTGLPDLAIRQGWNVRGYNWEFSLGVQREIVPRVSLDVSYFRRWFGNFTATDQLQLAPTDFDSFDVVAPVDSRLPGSGGYTIAGFVDPKTAPLAAATPINKVVLTDSIGAKQIQHWNGVDVSLNARLQNGLLLQGGTSTGRTYTNNCEVSLLLPETLGTNPQSFCEVTEPWLTQFKAVAAYTLPRYEGLPATMAQVLQNIQVAGTFQSIPGSFMAATYAEQNAEFNQAPNPALGVGSTLGRAISNNPNKNISLVAPGSVVDERQNQLDLRIGKILRFGRTRTSLNFDLFNVTNANTVITRNNALSKTAGNGINNQVLQADNLAHTLWVPTAVLQARFFKISATFDF